MDTQNSTTPKIGKPDLAKLMLVLPTIPHASKYNKAVWIVYGPNGNAVDWWFYIGAARTHAKQIGGCYRKLSLV